MRPVAREEIVAAARGWIGTPYRHQACLCGIGADCLGLVRGVWGDLYGEEAEMPPAYTPDWAEAAGRETLVEAARRHLCEIEIAAARAGDVLLFRWRRGLPAKHAAILTGGMTMIHAHEGAAVAEVALVPAWRRRIAYAFAFPGRDDVDWEDG
ncbi:NlpC/P60 family protein [Afifella sp. JA880]|uniref:NlpC/P60 family protein n=1 Tax=Afifella sp. JA880 TaxID=2975280 RepID=UPI0021BAA2E5|nr:NlpC/P60 family protein [Afifella sp. JA880]MCT8266762.1 NlpC/P60 family protein [Afifella sp. JA880]